MNLKDIVSKILNHKSITEEELNYLIIEYVTKETGSEPTSEELKMIGRLIERGLFSIEYVIDMIGKQPDKYKIQITYLYNVDNKKTDGMFNKELVKVIVNDI